MGYSGRILVARSSRPLSELAAVKAEVLHESTYNGDWRSAQLDGDLPGAVAALIAETGAQALSAYILDSDLADVEASSPKGVDWHVYLHEETAMSYGAPELPQTADAVVELAGAWSAEAGLPFDPVAFRAALEGHNTFAEDTFRELLEGLGISTKPSE